MRLRLPAANIFKVKTITILKMIKDLVGKDVNIWNGDCKATLRSYPTVAAIYPTFKV